MKSNRKSIPHQAMCLLTVLCMLTGSTALGKAVPTEAPPACQIKDCLHLEMNAYEALTPLCPLGEWMLRLLPPGELKAAVRELGITPPATPAQDTPAPVTQKSQPTQSAPQPTPEGSASVPATQQDTPSPSATSQAEATSPPQPTPESSASATESNQDTPSPSATSQAEATSPPDPSTEVPAPTDESPTGENPFPEAPGCSTAGCLHIGLGEMGTPTAYCTRGFWMLQNLNGQQLSEALAALGYTWSPSNDEGVQPSASPEAGLPTEAPQATETPLPTEAPPTCDLPGCEHLAQDAAGSPVALCPLGEWMLNNPVAADASLQMAPRNATLPTHIVLEAGKTLTLYRSGTYILSGGNAASKVIVSPNCVVALTLKSLTLSEISLGAGGSANIQFEGMNTLGNLIVPSGSSAALLGNGRLTLTTANIAGSLRINGGSVRASFTLGGYQLYSFPAIGTTSCMVNGASYPFTAPHADGFAYLWLPTSGGKTYTATVEAKQLKVMVNQGEAPTTSTDYDVDLSSNFSPVASTAYSLLSSKGSPIPQTLTIPSGTSDVGIIINSDLKLPAINVAGGAVTLYATGQNELGTVQATSLQLSGSGTLALASLSASSLSITPSTTIGYAAGGDFFASNWYAFATGNALPAHQRVTLDGVPCAGAYQINTTTLYLPEAPPNGMKYIITSTTSNTLAVQTVPINAGSSIVLDGANKVIAASGTYLLTSSGTGGGTLTIDPNVQATLIMQGVNILSTLHVDAGARLTLQGSGVLTATRLTGSGSASISPNSNFIATNIQNGFPFGAVANKLRITQKDDSSLPLRNAAVTLKIGSAASFPTTTNANGEVWLWRPTALGNVDAAVLHNGETYSATLSGGNAAPDSLPAITTLTDTTAGKISFVAKDPHKNTPAQTVGVQYVLDAPSDYQMPDTFLAGATRQAATGNAANWTVQLTGLERYKTVTYRVYASMQPNLSLGLSTADAFQFSEQRTITLKHKPAFVLEAQSRLYDGTRFTFKAGQIPKDATVSWYRGSTLLADPPRDVGSYTAKVTIPQGHAQYLPGTTDVSVTIKKITVWIQPDFAYKIEGEIDPEFPYTYTGTLPGDVVTGLLSRVEGEAEGNYPYLITNLSAATYYQLCLDPDSPMFYIFFDPGSFKPHRPYDPLAVIDPIHQVLVFSDGKKLDLILSTKERLSISGTHYGTLVTDSQDGRPRSFTPRLQLRPGYDAALLTLIAEPELNSDGGYATDRDGKILVRGRTLTLTHSHLALLRRQRITHIAFGIGETFCLLDLAELSSENVLSLMQQQKFSRAGSKIQLTVEPIISADAIPQDAPAALDAAQLQDPLAAIRLTLVNNTGTLDLTPALTGAQVLVDVGTLLDLDEPLPTDTKIEETVIGRTAPREEDENPRQQIHRQLQAGLGEGGTPTVEVLDLARSVVQDRLLRGNYDLYFFNRQATPLDSRLVVPYTSAEIGTALYPAILHTRPYLLTPLRANGLYGLSTGFTQTNILKEEVINASYNP